MNTRTLFGIGGVVASLILVAFGAASMVIGYKGREDVRDTLRAEQIVGPEDSRIPGQLVDTGEEARAQADIMREHQLKNTGGYTYAQMGRYAVASGDPKGTNVADEALKDANGKPVANAARSSWINAMALTTSLNTAYFAEQVGVFAIVMGAALLLTGVGFSVLTLGTLWHIRVRNEKEKEGFAGELAAAK